MQAESTRIVMRCQHAWVACTGGASSFVWGRQGLRLDAGEHVGGPACALWYGDERLAESGPFASAEDCEAALRHLVAELEARWRSLQAG